MSEPTRPPHTDAGTALRHLASHAYAGEYRMVADALERATTNGRDNTIPIALPAVKALLAVWDAVRDGRLVPSEGS